MYIDRAIKRKEEFSGTLVKKDMITNSEDKRKHFVTRGWSVTVLTGLLTIVIKYKNCELLILSTFVSILFWEIDSYYLSLESVFRDLYRQMVKLDPYYV